MYIQSMNEKKNLYHKNLRNKNLRAETKELAFWLLLSEAYQGFQKADTNKLYIQAMDPVNSLFHL